MTTPNPGSHPDPLRGPPLEDAAGRLPGTARTAHQAGPDTGYTPAPGPHPAPVHAPFLDEEHERDLERRLGTGRSRARIRGADVAVAAGAVLTAAALEVSRRAQDEERKNPPIGNILSIDGVRVHYIDRGSGPPVVLVHGNGTMIQDWVATGLVDDLAQRHRVIAIDRPGYGYTTRPRDRVWTPFAQAELVRKTLFDLGVHRPVVVGHSWGTLVSVALALDHPDEVAGLVLLSGYYYPTKRKDVWLFGLPAIPGIGDLMRYTVSPVIAGLLTPLLVRKSFKPQPVPRRFREGFPIGLTLRPVQIKGSSEDSALMVPAAADMQRRYGELRRMPIVLISGAGDEIVTGDRQSVRLHRELPASDLRVLPGLGHMLQYFAQNEIVDAVENIQGRR